MSGSLKLGLYLFGALLGLFLVIRIIHFALALLSIIVPVLAVVGIGVIVFSVVNRKSLGTGRRRILP